MVNLKGSNMNGLYTHHYKNALKFLYLKPWYKLNIYIHKKAMF